LKYAKASIKPSKERRKRAQGILCYRPYALESARLHHVASKLAARETLDKDSLAKWVS
jgi:hypothetical protein